MSAQHTPGPWATDEADHDTPYQDIKIKASKHRTICTVWIDDAPVRDFNAEQQANARRIVACVNACEGISTTDLESAPGYDAAINGFHEQRALVVQARNERDELLALLTEVAGNFTRDDDLPDNLLPRIDAAIDKAEGGAA